MTDKPPKWAMEKARELAASRDTYSSMMLPWITTIARALVETRDEALEEAAQIAIKFPCPDHACEFIAESIRAAAATRALKER